MEGPLSKWTNVMKGWQYRWFVLDYNAGLLSYYTVGSSPRPGPAGPRGRGAALVAVGYPPKASCLSGVGSLSWHTGAGLARPTLTLANSCARHKPTGQSDGSINSALP